MHPVFPIAKTVSPGPNAVEIQNCQIQFVIIANHSFRAAAAAALLRRETVKRKKNSNQPPQSLTVDAADERQQREARAALVHDDNFLFLPEERRVFFPCKTVRWKRRSKKFVRKQVFFFFLLCHRFAVDVRRSTSRQLAMHSFPATEFPRKQLPLPQTRADPPCTLHYRLYLVTRESRREKHV